MSIVPTLSSEIKGEGPSLLVLHGFTGDRSTMSSISEPLSENYSVVSVDLPGHGSTIRDLEPYLFNFEDTLAALIEVMEFHDQQEFNVLGYSMGGRLAIGLATKYPNRLKNMILIGATAGISDENQRTARRRSDDRLAGEILEKGIEWFVEYWMDQPIFESQIRIDSQTLDISKRQRLKNDTHGLANSLRGSGTGSQRIRIGAGAISNGCIRPCYGNNPCYSSCQCRKGHPRLRTRDANSSTRRLYDSNWNPSRWRSW